MTLYPVQFAHEQVNSISLRRLKIIDQMCLILNSWLPENQDRVQTDKNKEYYPYDENMGTIRFHSAGCLKGSRSRILDTVALNRDGFTVFYRMCWKEVLTLDRG